MPSGAPTLSGLVDRTTAALDEHSLEQITSGGDHRGTSGGVIEDAQLAAKDLCDRATCFFHDEDRREIVPHTVAIIDHVAPRVGYATRDGADVRC